MLFFSREKRKLDTYPTIEIDVTPEYVLLLIRHELLQDVELNPHDVLDFSFTFDRTIAEMRNELLLCDWKGMEANFNRIFDTAISADEWLSVLEPASEKTLGELCDFLTPYLKRKIAKPFNVWGKECQEAAVFLKIRSVLAENGVDVSELTPSSSLDEYALKHTDLFENEISRLAPGSFPQVEYKWRSLNKYPLFILFLPIMSISIIVTIVLSYYLGHKGWLFLNLITCMIFESDYIDKPISASFSGLKTFKDLSKAIAAGV